MKRQCIRHHIDLDGGRCPKCYDDNVRAWNERFPGGGVTGSIPCRGDEQVLVDGVPTQYCHKRDWLEYDVPAAITDELSSMIEAAIRRYEAKCKCSVCLEERLEKSDA